MQKKIVITGGPSTGKSTLISSLSSESYYCLEEVSREVILEAREKGIEHLFQSSPILFSEILLDKRIEQYKTAENSNQEIIFFDRSIIDIIAYLDFSSTQHTINFDATLKNIQYDKIFICPPWSKIHKTDNERYESFEESQKIHNNLVQSYTEKGYTITEIPFGTIKERTKFILDTIN